MKPKKTSYYFEFKQMFCLRYVIIIAIFFALLLAIAQMDIIANKKEIKEIEIANKLEKLKVEQFDRYKPYSVYGVRLFSMPSSLNFLSSFKIHSGLIAAVDTGTTLRIYETKKDNNVLPDPSYGFLNFVGLLIIFGSFLAMMLGYPAFNNEMELRFLFSLKSDAGTIRIRLTSRMIFITALLICLALCVFLLAWANGLTIPLNYFLVFWGVAILIMNFFLLLGTVSGSLKTRLKRITTFICLFLVVTIFSLLIIVEVVKGFSNNISEPQTEYDKLQILMVIEKRGITKFDTKRSGEEVYKFMIESFENDFKVIDAVEDRHKNFLFENIDKYGFLSALFPSTFFFMTTNEISGQGYKNYKDFYSFTEVTRREFIKFYIQKEFLEKPVPGKVESFIKGDENIFKCPSSIPVYFWVGISSTLFYIAVLAFLTLLFTYRKIYPVNRKLENEKDIYIRMQKGAPAVFFTKSELARAKIYNHLSGKERIRGEFCFEQDENMDLEKKFDMVFLPDPAALNDIKPRDLHRYLFGEDPENNMETWEVMLKYAQNFRIVIFDDFLKGMEPFKIDEIKKWLNDFEVYSITMTSDYYIARDFINERDQFFHLPDEKIDLSFFEK